MTGVILCGGQSVRMGQDKGLIRKGSDTWTAIAREKIRPFTTQCVISVNKNQLESYRKLFPTDDLVVDNPQLDVRGPLTGLLSVHLTNPDEDLLVLACDLPDMTKPVIDKLVETYKAQPNSPDAVVFKRENQIEPLCGIYSANGLANTLQHFQQDKPNKSSMMYVLDRLNTVYVPLPQEWFAAFRNINTPES